VTPLRLAALGLGLIGAFALGIAVGGAPLPLADVFRALIHPRQGGDVAAILWTLRLPRVCIAAFVGVALAIAGFLLQGMLRNPLVDPFLTGVSAGAGAAIAIAVALGASASFVPGVGFVAGLGTALLVAALARRGTGLDAERLILAGVSLSALFSALIALVLTRLEPGGAEQILAWLAGSLAGRGWDTLWSTAPYDVAGIALALAAVPALNALRLGSGVARAVGVDVARTQWMLLAAATLLTASAVSLSGILGFVGLIVPHAARRLVGTDGRVALPASALLGAILVIVADAASRGLMPPQEIPLGVLLAFVGVPAFLYLYLRPAGSSGLWGA
jgi:iron complex transport system permease protein